MARIPDASIPDDIPVKNNLVRTTYNNPDLYRGFGSLATRVHSASHLPSRIRELVVLRIAAKLAAPYEWGNHVVAARRAGVTDDEIRALRSGEVSGFTAGEAAAIRFAEAVEDRDVDEASWSSAREHYSEVELLDVTMLAAFYGLASRVVLALDIGLDAGLSGLDVP